LHTRLTVGLVAAGGFLIRFLRLGAIENDHYVYLARAHQMLHGDWPVRDFVDPGFPLGYLLSTVAAMLAGPTLLVEAVLSVALFAAALAVMFFLVQRATGSLLVGLLATALVLIVPPRLYNSSKMLVPLVAMAIAWAYSDRPSRWRAAAVGAWIGIAFLFRHDYAVLVSCATLAMLAVQHWRHWRLLAERMLTVGAIALVVAAPWLLYVQAEQGLTGYLAAALRFSAAEKERTVSHWAPIYYAMAAVPVIALLLARRTTRRLSAAQITFAASLVLISDVVLLRDAPGSRLADVYGTTAVAGAIVLGTFVPVWPRATRTATIATAVLATIIILSAVGYGWGPALNVPSRWMQVTARLREARPAIMPDPSRAPLVDYIRRCTNVKDRILVGGFAPELPVLAGRGFAGGMPDWIRGYYEHLDDVARARAQLARERVGLAVMIDGGDAFTRSWPAIAADLQSRGLMPHHLQLESGPVELWLPPSPERDGATGLPCRHH
jgi:4-amino-4-deoxy-L-arabinose transferase-like glycosyltransferase